MLALVFVAAHALAPAEKPVLEAVKAQLKDPESARFQGVKQYERGYWCGWVNSKNGYGGYTGFSVFMFHDGQAAILPPEQSDPSLCR